MKATKHFATANGQSHYPSSMKHVTMEVGTTITAEGAPLVVLALQRSDTATPTELRIRMNVFEAERLVQILTSGIQNVRKEAVSQ